MHGSDVSQENTYIHKTNYLYLHKIWEHLPRGIYLLYINVLAQDCCGPQTWGKLTRFLGQVSLLVGGAVALRNTDLKLLACLAMLAYRRKEKIVPRLLQSNIGVPSEVRLEDISGRAITVILLVYMHHGVEPGLVLETCNFPNYIIRLQIIKLSQYS